MDTSQLITLRRTKSSRVSTKPPALEALETRVVPYATTGNAWPHPQLVTISFVPDGTNLGGVTSNLFATFNAKWSTTAWENQILRAAQVWAQRANLNFTVVADTGASSGSGSYEQGDPTIGDIRIGGYNFGSSTLATGFLPPQGNNYSIAGDIDFNTGQVWAIGGTYDLFTVAAHEFGHALGMSHGTDATAVMYGSYNTRKTDLGSDDIAGIQAIYGPRTPDQYDTGTGNNTIGTAADITSTINSTSLSALINNLNIATTSDLDYYTFTAPAGTASSFTVKVQSSGLSLLCPALTVYAADQSTVLGSVTGLNRTGNTLSLTISNVTAGQRFYVKVGAADTTAFGTGAYALTLNFGTGPSPTVVSPNTQAAATGSPSTGGGMANDTLLPNDAVTQSTLTTADTVTSLALVPAPGTQPHGPGCTFPLCRGDSRVQISTPPAVAPAGRADNVSPSASALHPDSYNSSVGMSLVPGATGPATGADTGRSSTAAQWSISVINTVVVPASSSNPATSSRGIGTGHAQVTIGFAWAEPAGLTEDGAESSGESDPATSSEFATPDAEAELPTRGPLQSDNGIAPRSFTPETLDETSLLREPTEKIGDHVGNRDSFWVSAAGAIASIGLGSRSLLGGEERRGRRRRGKPLWSERRRNLRYPCWLNSYCLPLGKPLIERCQSVAQDVSITGVNLLLRRPFDEGTILITELQSAGGSLDRCVVARVIHVIETAPGVWELGCVFDRTVDDDAVQELILGGLNERAAALLAEHWDPEPR